jgi:hypothetical protein
MCLNYLRGTTTNTGLTVRATLLEAAYDKGQKVSDTEMEYLNIEYAEVCAQWNYTLHPRPFLREQPKPEVIY